MKHELESSLVKTIGKSALKDVTVDLAEISLDSMLKEGLLREVPIVGTVIRLASAGLTIRDQIFLNKVLRFLHPLSRFSPEQRAAYLDSLDPEELQRASQCMIVHLDKLDSLEKAALLGRIFVAYMTGEIDYRKMLYFAHFVQSVFVLVLQDYRAAIAKWENHRGGTPRIHLDDARALQVVGIYEERSTVQKDMIGSGEIVLDNIEVELVLSDAGWEFTRVVLGVFKDDADDSARYWCSVKIPRQ
jgi:hypothetical protein